MDGVIEEDDSGFVIMADVTPLFYILYQNIGIAVTIEILWMILMVTILWQDLCANSVIKEKTPSGINESRFSIFS